MIKIITIKKYIQLLSTISKILVSSTRNKANANISETKIVPFHGDDFQLKNFKIPFSNIFSNLGLSNHGITFAYL